jgi:hypothetical protein
VASGRLPGDRSHPGASALPAGGTGDTPTEEPVVEEAAVAEEPAVGEAAETPLYEGAAGQPWDEDWLPEWVGAADVAAEPALDAQPAADLPSDAWPQLSEEEPPAEAQPATDVASDAWPQLSAESPAAEHVTVEPAVQPVLVEPAPAAAEPQEPGVEPDAPSLVPPSADEDAEPVATAQPAAWEVAPSEDDGVLSSGSGAGPLTSGPADRPMAIDGAAPAEIRTPPAALRRRARVLLPLAVLVLAAVLAGFTVTRSGTGDQATVAAAERNAGTVGSAGTPSRVPATATGDGQPVDQLTGVVPVEVLAGPTAGTTTSSSSSPASRATGDTAAAVSPVDGPAPMTTVVPTDRTLVEAPGPEIGGPGIEGIRTDGTGPDTPGTEGTGTGGTGTGGTGTGGTGTGGTGSDGTGSDGDGAECPTESDGPSDPVDDPGIGTGGNTGIATGGLAGACSGDTGDSGTGGTDTETPVSTPATTATATPTVPATPTATTTATATPTALPGRSG